MTLTIVFGILACLFAVALYQEFQRKLERMERRIRKLEEANQKRMNYKSLESIENAAAALAAYQREHDMEGNLIQNAIAWMQRAHNPKDS